MRTEKGRRIVLYGKDPVVSTLGESLKGRADLQTLHVDPFLPDAARRLEAARADVVLFDLTGIPPDFAVSVLREQPGLVLIGVDLETDKVLVISGQEASFVTEGDLLRVIAEVP